MRISDWSSDVCSSDLTPRMKGRVDTSRYQKGAETIENAVVAVHGGVDRRGGFRYLATAKLGDERRVRLIRYVFNVDQAYLIERSEEHTSELQSLMRISYAVFCLKQKMTKETIN